MAQPTKYPPNTIMLGGEFTEVGDLAAGVAITPGMLIERYAVGTVPTFRPHTNADSEGSIYAMEQSMMNLGVDVPYAIGDLVQAAVARPGTTVWAIVASGANVAAGAKLSSAGNGKLKAGTTKAIAVAVESKDNSAGPGDARIRVEVL